MNKTYLLRALQSAVDNQKFMMSFPRKNMTKRGHLEMKSTDRWFAKFSLSLFLFTFCSQLLLAEDLFWTGANNGEWNELGNWINADGAAGQEVPQAGDTATFDLPTAQSPTTVPEGVDIRISSKPDAAEATIVELPESIINDLILEPGAQDVQLTFTGPVVVTGDLTVTGASGTVSTIQLNDNTLECADGTIRLTIPDNAQDSVIVLGGGSAAMIKSSKLELITSADTSGSRVDVIGPSLEVTGNFDVNTNTGDATIEPQGLLVAGDLTVSSIGDGVASLLMSANNLDVDGSLKITKTGGDLDAVESWPQFSSSGQSNVAGNVELKKVRFDADKVAFDGTDNQSVDFNGADLADETITVQNESGTVKLESDQSLLVKILKVYSNTTFSDITSLVVTETMQVIADNSKDVLLDAAGGSFTDVKLLEVKAGSGSGSATVSAIGPNISIEELRVTSEGTNTGTPTLDIGDNGMTVRNITLKDDGSESSTPTFKAGSGTIVVTGNIVVSGSADSPTVSFSPANDSEIPCEVILAGDTSQAISLDKGVNFQNVILNVQNISSDGAELKTSAIVRGLVISHDQPGNIRHPVETVSGKPFQFKITETSGSLRFVQPDGATSAFRQLAESDNDAAISVVAGDDAGENAVLQLNNNDLLGNSDDASLSADLVMSVKTGASGGNAQILQGNGVMQFRDVSLTGVGTGEVVLAPGGELTARSVHLTSTGDEDVVLTAGGDIVTETLILEGTSGAGVPKVDIENYSLQVSTIQDLGLLEFRHTGGGSPVIETKADSVGIISVDRFVLKQADLTMPSFTVKNLSITDTGTDGGSRKLTMLGSLSVTGSASINSVSNPAELNLNGNPLTGGGSISITSGSHPSKVLAVGSIEIGNLTIDSAAGQLAALTQTAGDKFEAGTVNVITRSSGSAELETSSTLAGGELSVSMKLSALELRSIAGSGSPKLNTNNVSVEIDGDLRLIKEGGNPLLTVGSGNIDVAGHLELTGNGTSLQLQSGSELVLDGIQDQSVDLTNVDLQASDVRLRISNNETESGQALATIILPDNFEIGGGLTVDRFAKAMLMSKENESNSQFTLAVSKAVNINGQLTTAETSIDFLDNNDDGVLIGPLGELAVTSNATIKLPKGQLDNSAGGIVALSTMSILEIAQDSDFKTNDNHVISTTLGKVVGNYNRQFTGSGSVQLLQGLKDNFPTIPLVPVSIVSGDTVEMIFGEDSLISTEHANVNLNGQVTVGKNTDVELWAGRPITFGSLSTEGNGDVNIYGKGDPDDGGSILRINGDVDLGTDINVGNGEAVNGGNIHIQFANESRIINNGTFKIEGFPGSNDGTDRSNRLLISAQSINQQLTMENHGRLDWEWAAVRGMIYDSVSTGSVEFGFSDSVVNATGNVGWPDEKFATPVDQGSSAITDFSTKPISTDNKKDSQLYNFYATSKSDLNESIDLFESGSTKDGVYVFAQNLDGNSSLAKWDETDPQALSEVAMGRYYVYLDPLGADANSYIIVSDHTVNISKIVFLPGGNDQPTSGSDVAYTSFRVDWTDDGNANATVELRYANGLPSLQNLSAVNDQTTLITKVSSAKDGTDGSYVWDTSGLATNDGATYYIYGIYYESSKASYSVSKGVKLKNVHFKDLPAGIKTEVDTASNTDVIDHKNYLINWSDWNASVGTMDIYVSQQSFKSVAEIRSASTAESSTNDLTRAVVIASDLDPAGPDQVSWNLTSGFGISNSLAVPEGDYYVYAVAEDINDDTKYSKLVTAEGQIKVKHNPFFYPTEVKVTSKVNSGPAEGPESISVSWKGGDWDDTKTSKVGIFYALKSAVDASPTNFSDAELLRANATEAVALDPDGVAVPTSQLTGLNLDQQYGFREWDYYAPEVVASLAEGEYVVWVVLEDADGDSVSKRSANTVTISHKSSIRIDDPIPVSITRTPNPYYTIMWTDVDNDQSALVDLYYSNVDLRGQNGVGGELTLQQSFDVATSFTKINNNPLAEDKDGDGDRYLFHLVGRSGAPIYDSQTYYIYALIDADGDQQPEAGYQSGGLIPERQSSILVTQPSGVDEASSQYMVEWMESWTDPLIDVNVDLYFSSKKTLSLSELELSLENESAATGIIARDLPLNQTSDGLMAGQNSAIWDDLVIQMGRPTGEGSSTNLTDSNLPPKEKGYYTNRRLVFTSGTITSAHKIVGYNPQTSTLTFTPPAAAEVKPETVTGYKIVVPDGTYYVYAVMDSAAGSNLVDRSEAIDENGVEISTPYHPGRGVNNIYNSGISRHVNPMLTGTATLGSKNGSLTEGTPTKIVDPDLTDEADLYLGARVIMTAGDFAGQSRTILGYDSGTGTLTLDHPFDPEGGSLYYPVEDTDGNTITKAGIDGRFRIDSLEIFARSVGAITITNHEVDIEFPKDRRGLGDYFDVGVKLDTNGQPIAGVEVYLTYDATTLEIADPTAPFNVLVKTGYTTKDSPSSGVLISSDLENIDYDGFSVIITSGKGRGSRSIIKNFDKAAKALTVDPPFLSSDGTPVKLGKGVFFRIDREIKTGVEIGDWSPTVNANDSIAAGELSFSAISTGQAAEAFSANQPFLFATFKTIAVGNANINFSFAEGSQTVVIDAEGEKHIPHGPSTVLIETVKKETTSLSGIVRLQGRKADHSDTVTIELRKPGSMGHYPGYPVPDSPAAGIDTDPIAPGIQLVTNADGQFTLTDLPSGRFFLTAKTSHHLRGQNGQPEKIGGRDIVVSKPIEIRPGQFISGVRIYGFRDLNGDAKFDGVGEFESELYAGEAGKEDNKIDLNDVIAFAKFYRTADATADIDGNGQVDIDDFKFIAKNFGSVTMAPLGPAGVAYGDDGDYQAGEVAEVPAEGEAPVEGEEPAEGEAPVEGEEPAAAPLVDSTPGVLEDLIGFSYLPSRIEFGQTVKIAISIDEDVIGYGFDLTYNSTQLLVEVDENDQDGFLINKIGTSGKDLKKLMIAQANSEPMKQGVILSLTPLQIGSFTLEWTNGQLVKSDDDLARHRSSSNYLLEVTNPELIVASALFQNYPNPFNPETWIPFTLKDSADVKIQIFDSLGQMVKILDLGLQESGRHISADKAAYWDGKNARGEDVASGVYFYRIDAGQFSETRKMVILK